LHGAPLGRHCSVFPMRQHSSLGAGQDDMPHVMLPEPVVAPVVTPLTVTPVVVAPTLAVLPVIAAVLPCVTPPPAAASPLPPVPLALVSKNTFPPQPIERRAIEDNR